MMENDMTMKEAVIAFWTKGFDFSGRARRSEYWLNAFANILIGFVLWIIIFTIDTATAYDYHLNDHFFFFISTILPYILLIPSMAQMSRRLQDINVNGKIAIIITVVDIFFSFLNERVFQGMSLDLDGNAPTMIGLNLLLFIPWLYLFVCKFIRGTHGDNKYGSDPKRIT